ncbi:MULTISPECIES: nucleotidyltransferase family protein [Gordonia]|uniref:nucleotidyltransferase family protein n=2 Tax=Gordonia TaxID=2053 RepID=UPI003CCDD9B9
MGTMPEVVVGAVLAAGAGRRYGMPKILAQQGEWLQSAVRALGDGGCDEVVVAMGAATVEPPLGARGLMVPRWSDGLSETVRAVLADVAARPEVAAVVLHVVDVADVDGQVVARILDVADGRRDRLVRARFRGVPGHPVFIGAAHHAGVRDAVRGDVGAAVYLRAHADRVIEVECGDLARGTDQDHRRG